MQWAVHTTSLMNMIGRMQKYDKHCMGEGLACVQAAMAATSIALHTCAQSGPLVCITAPRSCITSSGGGLPCS